MFFKRLSRRNTSDSYIDQDYEPSPRSEKFEHNRPTSSRQAPTAGSHNSYPEEPPPHLADLPANSPVSHEPHNHHDHLDKPSSRRSESDMYPRPRGGAQDASYRSSAPAPNGVQHDVKSMAAPDLLTQAFNAAISPYSEKIEQLEAQMSELQAWADTLQQQRAELWEWIDKRGLRPDVPASVAKQMDSLLPDAAGTLNAQLDRKITIVNFDLHRLQDDLNDSISASHFASAMAKFLPDIARLSALPGGSRYAFDLILKLGGNLNSHGGVEATAGQDRNSPEVREDLAARRKFYGTLDNEMVSVVRQRFRDGEDWMVSREIKRIEKTAAYLRNFGVEPYFPMTLDALKREGGDYRPNNGPPPPHGTPPSYS